ncbi:hypothetical protein CBF35_04325 [Vagococcus salmoninarum]|uniref:Flagellar protein FliL n=2 Tax=Vagococcus salmoninarum TaxID=2739 RepID=A0A429ZST8_9ENTE|nr:hypothetical protein CBF35_04325 [Vagococcus salmoninarum]
MIMEDQVDEQVIEKKKDKNRLMMLIILVLVVGVISGAAGTFIGNHFFGKVQGSQTTKEVEQKYNDNEISVPLEEFLINLAKSDNGETPYIKIEMSLLTANKKNAETAKASQDLVRDSVINLLRQKQANSILNEEDGVNKLKESLKKQINEDYGSELAREVFITNLVIQ